MIIQLENVNTSALRNALRYRQQQNFTYKQMCEHLFAEEVRKPESELNGVAIQFLDQLRNNVSLTPAELREFLVPAPNADSEVIVYGTIDWGQRHVSLLKILEKQRLRDQSITAGGAESDHDENPFYVFDPEINRRRSNIRIRGGQTERPRSRSRSPTPLPTTFNHYRTAMEITIRNEVTERIREETRRELEPRIRHNIVQEYNDWFEIQRYVAIEEERVNEEESTILKLRELAAKPFIVDTSLDDPRCVCPICFESLMNRRPVSTGCGHICCIACFIRWHDELKTKQKTCFKCAQILDLRMPRLMYPSSF